MQGMNLAELHLLDSLYQKIKELETAELRNRIAELEKEISQLQYTKKVTD